MADAAVQAGMPRKQAYELAAQTVLGSAKLALETGTHPGALKDMVCSPGGTTIEAVKVLEEKEKLSLAIVTAKKTTKIDIDHSIAMNKKRQEFVSSLNFMNGIKNRETKSRGTDYKFNQEGNQISYYYDIDEIITIDFDRNDIKGLIKKLTKQSDELSITLDGLLITTEVDYIPVLDINDSLEDIILA